LIWWLWWFIIVFRDFAGSGVLGVIVSGFSWNFGVCGCFLVWVIAFWFLRCWVGVAQVCCFALCGFFGVCWFEILWVLRICYFRFLFYGDCVCMLHDLERFA